MNAITAVGFDLDGTLFDHAGAATQAIEVFLASLGVEDTDSLRSA